MSRRACSATRRTAHSAPFHCQESTSRLQSNRSNVPRMLAEASPSICRNVMTHESLPLPVPLFTESSPCTRRRSSTGSTYQLASEHVRTLEGHFERSRTFIEPCSQMAEPASLFLVRAGPGKAGTARMALVEMVK